jgi:acyl-coenzyme A thioesterase PaaI-like protein
VSGGVRRAKPSERTAPPPLAVLPEPHPEAPKPGSLLPPHYRRCFGCGPDHPTGLHMRHTVGEGLTVYSQFTVSEEHQGAPGLAHGGLLAAAFDEALGSVGWLLFNVSVTARLETDFVRPVPVGTTLHITARCDGVEGRKVYLSAEGHLGEPDGTVAVRSTAVFISVPAEHFATYGRPEDVAAAAADPARRERARAFEVNP